MNIFYDIVSIFVGILFVLFGIFQIKKQSILFSVLVFIQSVGFLVAGIGGFFLPKAYEYITILAMLAFCITMGITLLLLYKKTEKTTSHKKTLDKSNKKE